MQVTAASASILIAFVSGLTLGYVAILSSQLRGDSASRVDMATMAWIAATAGLPIAPGCLISGWIMELFGRRTSLRIICVLIFNGWILTVAATISSVRIPFLLAGRFLSGICIGLSAPLSPIYIGETMEPKHRGFFLAGLSLVQAQGLLAIHILGSSLTWQWIACICCIFPLLAMGILFVIPESPTWLIAKGRVEEGVKAYGWLRGYNDEANAELRGILEKQRRIDSEPAMNWLGKLRMLKSRELLKPLFIMTFFFIVSELSGVHVVMFYSVNIIEQAFVPNLNGYVAAQWLYVGMVVVFALACVICQYIDRRPVCLFSGVLTALSLICVSITCYTAGTGMPWPPLLCLILYMFAVCIGLVPLPWVMCAEIFPMRIRGLGSATYFFVSFVMGNSTPLMADYLGYCSIFLVHGVLTLAGTVLLYFILPETKGKTLQEMEEEFK